MSMQNIWAARSAAQNPESVQDFTCEIEPAAGSMGAYVRGIDITESDGTTLDEVRRLLLTYKAVMLRGQRPDLSIEQYVAFGEQLGELAIDPFVVPPIPEHPEIMGLIREADDTTYNFGGDWHSDGTYLEQPGGLTILWGKDVPPYGGDTLFSNMELAWDMLSPAFQDMLDGRRCLHAATGLGTKAPITRKGDYATVNFGVERDQIAHFHPIKRTHPETGNHALFVNQAYSVQIEGCTEDESAGILTFLFDWTASPAMTARLRWEPNTVMVWDNRSTTHYAIADYGGFRREMYRLAITGEVPQ